MRYANIERLGYEDGKNSIGVGDYIQLLAIDSLYQEMGVNNEVIYLNGNEISEYSGEELVLPINQLIGSKPWLDAKGDFAISQDITPIFLGVSLRKGFFIYSEYNLAYLRKYAPIGCRDYYTYQQMRKYNIPAYMAGCLTMTLPKRKERECEKIYLVDVPSGVREYIPDEIAGRSEIIQHVFETSEEHFLDPKYARNMTIDFFEKYRDTAAMIVTSRLHCSSPCLAMGIPVIIAKQYRGYTFDWMQGFARFYNEGEYEQINWKPQGIEIEEYKGLARHVAISRIKGNCIQPDIEQLHDFYMKDYTEEYKPSEMTIIHFVKELEKRYARDEAFDYAIWGIGETAECIYNYICVNYPKARLVKAIDTFSEKIFHGMRSEKPEILQQVDPFVTIVTTINCMDSGAKPLFAKLGKNASQYIYAADEFLDNL